MKFIAIRACALQLVFASAAILFAQDRVVITPKKKDVPAGYKAYSLFLIPSTDWRDKDQDLRSLRSAFQDFGDAIGNQKAAIWFSNDDDTKPDFVRSKSYCDKFGLAYNDGPFVVTMKSSPEAVRQGDQIVVIKLGGISSDRVVSILNILEQDLRTEREIRKRELLFEEIRQRVMTAKQRYGPELKEIATTLLKVK